MGKGDRQLKKAKQHSLFGDSSRKHQLSIPLLDAQLPRSRRAYINLVSAVRNHVPLESRNEGSDQNPGEAGYASRAANASLTYPIPSTLPHSSDRRNPARYIPSIACPSLTMSDMRIRNHVKLAAPEPEVLRIVGEEAKRNGTSRLTSRQIDRIIRATRAAKKKK